MGRDSRPRSVRERPRSLACGETTEATGGASPHWGSCTRADREDAGERTGSSDQSACFATLGVGGYGANNASEGRGDCTRFASRSMAVSPREKVTE